MCRSEELHAHQALGDLLLALEHKAAVSASRVQVGLSVLQHRFAVACNQRPPQRAEILGIELLTDPWEGAAVGVELHDRVTGCRLASGIVILFCLTHGKSLLILRIESKPQVHQEATTTPELAGSWERHRSRRPLGFCSCCRCSSTC
eukprot:754819-Hanusia_phi.AAC.3